MKILASDYDGTLFIGGGIKKEVIKAIGQWKAAGNKFGLVTGRCLFTARDAILENNLDVDFIICNNGCTIYDSNLNEIYISPMATDIVGKIINSQSIKLSKYIILTDKYGRYVYDDNYAEGKYKNAYHTGVLNSVDIKGHTQIYQIDTKYDGVKEVFEAKASMELEFGGLVTINANVDSIDLNPYGETKLTGLQHYINKMGIQATDIITVGDSYNDLPMILHYGGYTMSSAYKDMKQKVGKVVGSVADIISKGLMP
ncbi:MAG: Cof-type HAD-IIB family hydrolase [Clostridiales bacterium]|jgi:HAD superfamily hydrolase (TIGR01484 family)|nr:Cof-type HAD-IIB family hydrolase [Clostridiales bacterium]